MTDKPDRRALHNRRKRAAMKARGLKRREVPCYEEDWPAIKAFAEELTERRETGRAATRDE